MKDNENTTYQHLWDITKVVIEEKFKALYLKGRKIKITFYYNELEEKLNQSSLKKGNDKNECKSMKQKTNSREI